MIVRENNKSSYPRAVRLHPHLRVIRKNTRLGQSIVEILVALSIFAIASFAVVTLVLDSYITVRRGGEMTEAVAMAREGIDAARSVINQAFNELPIGGTYGISNTSGYWQLSGISDVVNQFTRTLTVEDVYRDISGNIVQSGGTIDRHTKKITASVVWDFLPGKPATISLVTYFGNWLSRDWFEDLVADFSDGTFSNTEVTNNGDGEVALQGGSGPTWECLAETGSYNAPSNANGNDVFVVGTAAYLVTSSSGGAELYILDISTPATPVLLGSLNLGATANALYVSGNYAYIATSKNNQELMVVDISNPSSLSINGSYNAPSGANATDIFISGNRAYLTTNDAGGANKQFYILNISTPTTPALVGSYDNNSNVSGVYISGSYAYLATALNSKELVVLDISNEASPTEAANYDAPGGANGNAVFISGTYAYLGRVSSAQNEFVVLDISTPTNPVFDDSLDIGNNVNSIFVDGNYAFVGNNLANQELQIIDISTPTSITAVSGTDTNGAVRGVFVSSNTVYTATVNNTKEFIILDNQTGGFSCLAASGSYNTSSSANGFGVFTVGTTVYLVTANNSSGGSELYIFDASNPDSPSLSGSLNLGATANNIFVSGNYAYITTNRNNRELVVVDISNPASLSIDGSYNAPSGANGLDIFVSGSRAYLTTANNNSGDEFYILDITNPLLPSYVNSYNAGANVRGIYISGNYAYAATDINNAEFAILDISNELSLSVADTYNTPSNANGSDVIVSGNTAYLSTFNNNSGDEFYIFDVTTPTNISLTGSYNYGSNLRGARVDGNNALLAGDRNNQEIHVVDISTPSAPAQVTVYDNSANDANSIFVLNNIIYLATDGNTNELQIVKQSASSGGGGAYLTSGYYISSDFDTGQTSNFNIIQWSEDLSCDAGGSSSNDWPFNTAGNYTYDGNKIEVTGGVGRLKQQSGSQVDDTQGEFDAGTYNNTNWYTSAVKLTPGSVPFNTSGDYESAAIDSGQKSSWDQLSWGENLPEVCDGTALSCNTFGDQPTCDSQTGCSWGGSCSGTCTPCGNLNYSQCGQQSGCFWFFFWCLGACDDCATFGSQSQCGNQLGCSWGGGGCSGTHSACSTYSSQSACAAEQNCSWATSDIQFQVRSDNDNLGWGNFIGPDGTPSTYYTTSGGETITNLANNQFFQYKAYLTTGSDQISPELPSVTVNYSYYAADLPTIRPASSLTVTNLSSWDSFAETATKNGGEIYYQLSDDDGATWQYWSGVAWVTAGGSDYNTAAVINTNIGTFSTAAGKIMWKAFLSGDGSQQVILDNVNIGYTTSGGGGGGNCDLQLQIRTAATQAGLATAEWAGPEGKDGDETDYFTNANGEYIHTDHNGDRWVRYKATFTSDGTGTPYLQDININYSPY